MFTKISLAAMAASAQAGDTAFWKQRTVYQLLTDRYARTDGDTSNCDDLHHYCGGTFKGIENHLDYIQGMGFDAIWISPVPENTDGDYHGYAAKNWEKINDHFGTEDELKSLVDTAHSKGIAVMVDVVANHSGCVPGNTDFSGIYPLNKSEHYHSECYINNWNDQNEVENCRLACLPDLNQQNPYVR
jgi:alpha-amylase